MLRIHSFARVLVVLMSVILCIAPTVAAILFDRIPAKAAPVEVHPASAQQDTDKIVFASERDGNREIYVMDANGGNPINLSQNEAVDDQPVLSPDGSKIAFASLRDLDWEVYVMDVDGGNPINLTNSPGTDFIPAWSPDGSQIGFSSERDGNLEIYVMGADGSNPTRLTTNDAIDEQATWSPDGSKILFASNRDGDHDVYVMDANGDNPIPLTVNDDYDYRAEWSPDGNLIAFSTNRDGNFEIYLMTTGGDNQTNITNNSAGDFRPEWSPDGSQLVFFTDRDGNYEIYTMNVDGSGPVRLTTTEATEWNPAWTGPAGPGVLPGGEEYPPLVHAVLNESAKATLNANPTHGYIGQKVTLTGQLSEGYEQVQIVTTMNGQTLRTQAAQAAPGGAYSTEFTIPDHASPGTLEVCAAVAGIELAEFSCLNLQIDPPPGGTVFGNVPGSVSGGATKVGLLNAAGTLLYSAPVGNNGDFSIRSVLAGTYKTAILGAVQEPIIEGFVAIRPDTPIQVIFNRAAKCLYTRNNGNFEVTPTRKTFKRLRGSSIVPTVTKSSPFGIYVSGVPLQVTFTANPQEIHGTVQRVIFRLVNRNGATITTIEDTVAPWSATFNVGSLSPANGDDFPQIRAEAYDGDPANCPTHLAHDIEVIANPFGGLGVRPENPTPVVWNPAAQRYDIHAVFPDLRPIIPIDFKIPPPPVPEIPAYGRLDNHLDAGIHLIGTLELDGNVRIDVVRGELNVKLMNQNLINEQRTLSTGGAVSKLGVNISVADAIRQIQIPIPEQELAKKNFTLLNIKQPIVSIGFADIVANANASLQASVILSGRVKPLVPELEATLRPAATAKIAIGVSGRLAAGLAEVGGEGSAVVNASAPLILKLLPDPSAQLDACLDGVILVRVYAKSFWGYGPDIPIKTLELARWADCTNLISPAVQVQHVSPSELSQEIPEPPALFASPAIAVAADGTQLSAYVENTASAGETESIQVLARFKALDATDWSEPVALSDPAHSSRGSVVAFVGPDATPIVAWFENTLTKQEADALGDDVNGHLRRQEIVYSVWDGESWGAPIYLTQDLDSDGMPALTGSSAGAVLAWVRDTDGDVTTRADVRIAVSHFNFATAEFEAPELLTAESGGYNADLAAAYDETVDPPQPYLVWIHDADANLVTAPDRTVAAATHDGSVWTLLNMSGLPTGVDSPAISAGNGEVKIAFLVREPGVDGQVALIGANGVLWTAVLQAGVWNAQPLPGPNDAPVYAERPILDTQGEESLLVFRRFGESENTGGLGQIALSQFMVDSGPTVPLYLTDQAIQNWQPAFAMNPLDGTAVILKVARTSSVSAAALETAALLDSIAATEVVMAGLTTTLSANDDLVEEVGVAAFADPALAPLTVSASSPAPDDVVTVHLIVRNAGRNATGDITVSLYRGEAGSGTLIDSEVVPAGLTFGDSYVTQMGVTASGGEQPIYAELTTDGENQSDANDRAVTVLGRLSTPTMAGVTESAEYLDALSISWIATPNEYVTGYRILRSTAEEGPFELVGEASITSFTDTLLEPGQSYCYAVEAYNTNILSAQSSVACGALPQAALFMPIVQR